MATAQTARQPGHASTGAIVQAGELRSSRIESLRALAALAVLEGHVYAITHGATSALGSFGGRVLLGGGFGVELFFALTGYLLFWPFVRRMLTDGPGIDLRGYAMNRALRILPLYYIALVTLFVAHGGGEPWQWWRFALLAENYSRATFATVDGPMWSLVVELQFYVLLPLLAWAISRLARGSTRRAGMAVVGLALLAFAVRTALRHHFPGEAIWRDSLPGMFVFFTSGMMLALVRIAWERHAPAWLPRVARRTDLWLLASAALWVAVFWRYDLDIAVLGASFLAIGACVLPLRSSPLVRCLQWRPLAALGVASYSLYVWHVPILIALDRVPALHGRPVALGLVAAPLCCMVAALSYVVIEAPFLRLRRRWSEASAPLIAATRHGR